MSVNKSERASSLDRALAVCLVMFSMFVVGYTASRAFFSQEASQTSIESTVIPHQASMWSDLGR